jgi:Secretion system C-terminal sorting domain
LITFHTLSFFTDDVFLAKYSPSGSVLWAQQAVLGSGACLCNGSAIVCDKSGNVYLAGNFVDTVTFGSHTLIGKGLAQNLYQQANLYLVKYDSTGNVLWAKQGTVLDSNSWGVATLSIDKYNHIFLSGGGGTLHCKIAFGTDTLSMFDTAVYDQSSILVKFDSNGNVLCSTIIAGAGHFTNSLSTDSSGNHVYFGGCTATILVFGNDTINPFLYPTPGSTNSLPFVARWDECGDITTATNSPPKEDMNAEVYPNPNNGAFTLSVSNMNENCNVEIYNVLGDKVYFATLKQVQDDNTINLTGQPNGIYLYRVISEDSKLIGSGKVIIER